MAIKRKIKAAKLKIKAKATQVAVERARAAKLPGSGSPSV